MKKLLTTLMIVFVASTVMGQKQDTTSKYIINGGVGIGGIRPMGLFVLGNGGDKPVMEFHSNGDIYHLGKKLTTDIEIVNGLRAVFRGQIDSLKNEIHKRNQIIAHKQKIIEKIDKVAKGMKL